MYKMTMTVPFDAFDDVAARMIAQEVINSLTGSLYGCKINGKGIVFKLQKVFDNKPPEKVAL